MYTLKNLEYVARPDHVFNYLHTFISGKIDVCYNPKAAAYKYYGARKILVYDEWIIEPKQAMLWVLNNLGPRPSELHTLDRIDNDGHCVPGNLRWATHSEQQLNKRPWTSTNEKFITYCTGRNHYRVILSHRRFIGSRKTLEDAIKLRDSVL